LLKGTANQTKNFIENISPAIEFDDFLKQIQKLPKTSTWMVYGTALTTAYGRRVGVILHGEDLAELFAMVNPKTKWRFNSDKHMIIRVVTDQIEVVEASRLD